MRYILCFIITHYMYKCVVYIFVPHSIGQPYILLWCTFRPCFALHLFRFHFFFLQYNQSLLLTAFTVKTDCRSHLTKTIRSIDNASLCTHIARSFVCWLVSLFYSFCPSFLDSIFIFHMCLFDFISGFSAELPLNFMCLFSIFLRFVFIMKRIFFAIVSNLL